ncbi:hypothetical protein ACIBG4_19360 [Nonomuraea sp. NPDC050383]
MTPSTPPAERDRPGPGVLVRDTRPLSPHPSLIAFHTAGGLAG